MYFFHGRPLEYFIFVSKVILLTFEFRGVNKVLFSMIVLAWLEFIIGVDWISTLFSNFLMMWMLLAVAASGYYYMNNFENKS